MPVQKLRTQTFIPQPLFLFGKVRFSGLFRTITVIQRFISELLAGQVKHAAVCHIEAVVISIGTQDAKNFPAENVLHQESRDGTLSEGGVLGVPRVSHSWCAGVGAPDTGEDVVIIPRCQSAGIFYIGSFPAIEIVFLHLTYPSMISKYSLILASSFFRDLL